MRRLIYFFLILFFISPVTIKPAFSQEFISGTILEINPKKMEIVVGLNELHDGETHDQQKILIRPSQDNIFPESNGKSVLPGCVIEGDQIRIWGNWDSNSRKVFLANDIRGCKGGGCSDPTGIMSRLKRHSNSHRQNMRRHGSGRGSRYRGGNR